MPDPSSDITNTPRVRTPCIGICSTTSVGDPLCRGCKRFAFEVINWNGYQEQEKAAVMDRIETLVRQIFRERFLIRDSVALQTALQQIGLPIDAGRSPYLWLHNFLKKHHRDVSELDRFGVEIRPAYAQVDLPALIEQADQELLTLSDAHYQRYFTGAG